MAKRKSTGKRKRFAIFARDGFACRYCGRQSDEVKLVLDHMIPVSKGGTDDESNLITSCHDCNAGKSDTEIDSFAPNETDRLRLAQERAEQIEAAEAASQAAMAREQLFQTICNYLCDASGQKSYTRKTVACLTGFAQQHGHELVFEWIDSAYRNVRYPDDVTIAKYVSGCRRRHNLEILEN